MPGTRRCQMLSLIASAQSNFTGLAVQYLVLLVPVARVSPTAVVQAKPVP